MNPSTRILVVDDKEENLYFLRVLLTGQGCDVIEACNGAEALTKAHQNPPDLIISDLLMPVMDGYTLLRQWKADDQLKQIPFVVFTATYTEPNDQRLASMLGADDFIVKPTEPDVFLAHLEEVMAKKANGTLNPPVSLAILEKGHFKEYSESLIRKLEDKMTQLELTNRQLKEELAERHRLQQEQMLLEAQLRHQQKLEAIGTLAAGVAHEINNPVNGIMNYAQLIMDTAGLDEELIGYARNIIGESERVARITRNLLQFARQEKQTYNPEPVSGILEKSLSLMQALIRHDRIALLVDVPDTLPTVRCCSQHIQQVLINLLSNARDALNEKYPKFDENKKIIISAKRVDADNPPSEIEGTQTFLRITVEDHGLGIPLDKQDKIFNPFFTTKPRDKGTGLGLSISHGIIKDHSGKLWFETEAGQWTRFHVDLPLVME